MSLAPPNPSSLPRWDPWILPDGDGYLLFYLSGRTDEDPWWKTSWICGGYSQNGKHWHHSGPVIEPLPNQGWESGRIFAGSAYKENDRYYLFYSAASEDDIANEAIGLATSQDGKSWQRALQPLLSWKDSVNIRSSGGVGYAGRCNWDNHLHWRDPYVVKSAADEKYYLFFCTSLTGAERYQGGLGIAIADKINGPYQLLPPAAGPGIASNTNSAETELWPFYHLERPQVIFFQGRYHLFFSCFKESINPLWLAEIGENKVSDSTLYWYVSEKITGPFHPANDLPVVPGSESTELYGTTFFFPGMTHIKNQSNADQLAYSVGKESMEMTVLGWYSSEYRLAISEEFSGVWRQTGLRIF